MELNHPLTLEGARELALPMHKIGLQNRTHSGPRIRKLVRSWVNVVGLNLDEPRCCSFQMIRRIANLEYCGSALLYGHKLTVRR